MQIFRSDQNAACLEFPPTLTHQQRSIVHTLAARLDLEHASHGVGADRYIVVTRHQTPLPSAPPTQSTSPDPLTFQQYRPMPTTRASTELLTQHPPLSPRQQDLRASRSMTNLRGGNDPNTTLPPSSIMPPPYPRIPTDYTAFTHHDLFSRQSPLGHRASQESTMSSRSYSVLSTTVSQPTRQPHGPVDKSRGFTERPSRETFQPQSSSTAPAQQSPIRPIGHGAKTPSHGSVSHGSGSRESRGGSDSILDLQIQNTIPHEF
jgi:R3H domain